MDPRAENCRAYRLDDNGRVIGVELQYVPNPSTVYELVRVELIDEPANGVGGPTVATCTVLDRNGIQTGERVYLAWPFPTFEHKLLPGNPRGEHMITNGYAPPGLGLLALYVGDERGNVISDVINGLGLPINHHISFRATWRERGVPVEGGDGGIVIPGGEAEGPALVIPLLSIAGSLERQSRLLEALLRHIGVSLPVDVP